MSDGKPLICLHDVTKTFDEGRVVALDKTHLEVRAGEFVAIMGPSGSGKTTLLNLIGAMDTPTAGDIFVDGIALHERRNLEVARAEKIGFIFQMHNLIPVLTAIENVEIPMYGRRRRKERRERARHLLELVGLSHRAGANVRVLSGGERQRVAIARALANEPPLLLADEPTGSLDSRTGESVMKTLHEARAAAGSTLILVTHNAAVAGGADRALRMHDGRLQEVDAARGLQEEPSYSHRR